MYRALRAFIDKKGRRIKAGDKVDYPDSIAHKYKKNGLIYESKEEKKVYERHTKATKEHTGSGWYLIKKGHQVIDKVRGKETAQEKVDEINGD